MTETAENYDTENDDQPKLEIQEYSQTVAALNILRRDYAGVVFDVATTKGMAEAQAARTEIRTCRTNLDKLRKKIKAPALKRCNDIDAEAASITEQIREIEDPIAEQIEAEKARKEKERQDAIRAEEHRLEDINNRIAQMRQHLTEVQLLIVPTSEKIEARIRKLEAVEVDETFDEFQQQAQDAKTSTLSSLREIFTAAVAREAEEKKIAEERAELEKLRKEAEERAAAEEAEAARKRAIKEEQDRKAQEAADKRRAEEEAKAQAELEKQRKAQEAEQAKIDAENKRIAEERAALEKAQREESERKAAEKAAAERRREEAEEAARLAKFPGIEAIELALTNYFGVPVEVARKWIAEIRNAK